jgi:hypothetical protein
MVRALAILALFATPPSSAPDPCRAARAPLPELSAPADRGPIEGYRAAWRRACEPGARPAELAPLLGDAEALVADVGTRPTLEAIAAALPLEWPVPGIRRKEGGPLVVDWAAFAAAAPRGTVEDARFWRAAAVVAGPGGEPAWLGERIGDGPARCLRLAELRWREVADALDAMERAGAEPYLRQARALRASLMDTLEGLARQREVCACLPGDAAGALEPLGGAAAVGRGGAHARRALAKAAAGALGALRSGAVRVLVLRAGPGAPVSGCSR